MSELKDEELHAYLDGVLDPQQSCAMAQELAAEPELAARAEEFRAQRSGLAALYGHVLVQPIPDRLLAVFRDYASRTNRRCFLEAAAAAGVALSAAVAGGDALRRLWSGASREARPPRSRGARSQAI